MLEEKLEEVLSILDRRTIQAVMTEEITPDANIVHIRFVLKIKFTEDGNTKLKDFSLLDFIDMG